MSGITRPAAEAGMAPWNRHRLEGPLDHFNNSSADNATFGERGLQTTNPCGRFRFNDGQRVIFTAATRGHSQAYLPVLQRWCRLLGGAFDR
jgi:hypothetical protein